MVDKYGFDSTFCITAVMQAVGAGILVLLLPLVPRVEDSSPSLTDLTALDYTSDLPALAVTDVPPGVLQPDAIAGDSADIVDMTSHATTCSQ